MLCHFQPLFIPFYFFIICFCKVETAKPKTKAALFPATQVNTGGIKNQRYNVAMNVKEKELLNEASKNLSKLKHLKLHLLSKFDRTLHPVGSGSGNIEAKIGFTFRQILDLDEKNQILKSLVWYSLSWNDPQLSWKPEDFDGIKNIELPNNLLWRPDVVVYEEIGVRDYNPRLQNFEINSNGDVHFREPTVFETTCSINTAFFPFDVQVCYLTFVSWTDAVDKIDLVSSTDTKGLQHMAKKYFVNTGEWRLIGLAVEKVVKDYAELLKPHPDHPDNDFEKLNKPEANESELNINPHTEKPTNIHSHIQFARYKAEFKMSPKSKTTFSTLRNTSLKNTMFAEIKYTIVIRRNSSLYMQSMLFPSILLTAVAVLGFYLPPDSGERIGLQITILLTFMVFLLAVGEMFPASTGPYLGVYFVLCMGLLGINLSMTVLVLNLHFKPVIIPNPDLYPCVRTDSKRKTKYRSCCQCNYSKRNQKIAARLKACKCNRSAIPKTLSKFLRFCDSYWCLNEYNAKWLQVPLQNSSDEENDSACISSTPDDSSSDDNDVVSDLSCSDTLPTLNEKNRKQQIYEDQNKLDVPKRSPPSFQSRSTKQSEQIRTSNSAQFLASDENQQNIVQSLTVESELVTRGNDRISSPMTRNRIETIGSPGFAKEEKLPRNKQSQNISLSDNRKEANLIRKRLINVLQDVRSYVKKSKKGNRKKTFKEIKNERMQRRKKKVQEREAFEQEEWKSVARAVDTICFRLYILFIILSHVGLFAVAFENWYTEHNFDFYNMN